MSEATIKTVCTACRHRDICKHVAQAAEMTTAAKDTMEKYEHSPLRIDVVCSRRDASGQYVSMFDSPSFNPSRASVSTGTDAMLRENGVGC